MSNALGAIEVPRPPSSVKNLSRIWQSTMGPGYNVPCFVEPVMAGDRWHITCRTLVKTIPAEGPLMSGFTHRLHFFFSPVRFYNASLHDNPSNFDYADICFPTLRFNYLNQITNDEIPDENTYFVHGCHESSLLHYLGVCRYFLNAGLMREDFDGDPYRYFSALPFCVYWDIDKTFFIHTQEPTRPVIGGWTNYTASSLDSTPVVRQVELSRFDELRRYILRETDNQPNNIVDLSAFFAGGNDIWQPNDHHFALGGLLPVTYRPDVNHAWVNSESYALTLSRARVDTAAGYFDLDQFAFAKSMNKMLQQNLVAGTRYSDWSYVNYGVSMRSVVEVPVFLGGQSFNIEFNDVVQTSDIGVGDRPLGTLGGRGVKFQGSSRPITHFATENGIIMAVNSLVPFVTYSQGVKHYMRFARLSDFHIPVLDNIGFEDLFLDNVYAAAYYKDISNSPYNPDPSLEGSNSLSIGKQPAWTQFTTAVSEVHGEFANINQLAYMVLNRWYFTNGVHDPSVFPDGISSVDVNTSVYIDPSTWNYAFADTSLTAQNFWVQHNFTVKVRRAMSKRRIRPI